MFEKLNYQIYRAKYRFGRSLPLRVPVDVSLELASQCNMKCAYCYHSASKVPFTKGLMDGHLAIDILDQCAEIGVHSIKTNYRGESTINPHFEAITWHAKKLHEAYGGATLIDRLSNSNFKFRSDREDIFRGFANQTKVKVSYDSFRKDVFETQRAGGDHDITSRNIDLFYNHSSRIRSGTKLVIQAVRTKLNKDEDLAHECKKRWPDATISIREVVEGRIDNEAIEELKNETRDDSERVPCLQAFVRLMVNHDGKVQLCCPDIKSELIIGDAKKTHLHDIFNSPKAKTIRKKLKNKQAFKLYDACKNCSSYESYKNFKANWDS